MVDRRALGKRSRRKGKTWERKIARDLKDIFGGDVRRGWQSRQGDDEADVEQVPLFWIEAKHGKGASGIRKALAQATDATTRDRWPVAICKDERVTHWADARLSVVFVAMWADQFDFLAEIMTRVVGDGAIPPHRVTVRQKRARIASTFLRHAPEHDGKIVLTVADEGQRPICVISYSEWLRCLGVWFDALVEYVRKRLEELGYACGTDISEGLPTAEVD